MDRVRDSHEWIGTDRQIYSTKAEIQARMDRVKDRHTDRQKESNYKILCKFKRLK